MKRLLIIQKKPFFGFGHPQEEQIEAVQWEEGKARGKIALAQSDGQLVSYENIEELREDLARSGDFSIEEQEICKTPAKRKQKKDAPAFYR